MARSGKTKPPTGAPSATKRKRVRAAPLEASLSRRGEAGRRADDAWRAKRPAVGEEGANGDKVNVFISYVHGDHVVAAALRDALEEVNRDRVECFLDSASIESGEEWKDELDAALAAADWLVCVYTGEQSQWCGYEVGVFAHHKAQAGAHGDTRVVCLHDTDTAPGLFADSQNKPVKFLPRGTNSSPADTTPAGWHPDEARFYAASRVFQFLWDFCAYKDLYLADKHAEIDRKTQTLLFAAKRITLAFEAARAQDVMTDTPTQCALKVSFGSGSPGPFRAVPPDAKVSGTSASFNLFGLRPPMANEQLPSITWAELKAACQERSPTNALWMESLEQEMVSTTRKLALGTPEAVFSAASSGNLFRAVLVRHVVRYDWTNEFDLIFIETLPRRFGGLAKTSLLLAGLVQASRFRFAFLEQPEYVAAKFDGARSDKEFEINCKQLRYDIARIDSEAAELGVLDVRAFIAAFGDARRAQAERFIRDWKTAKEALLPQLPDPDSPLTMESRAQARKAITAFLASMANENRNFVLAALDAYREEVAG
jgi:hypothetical protein